MTRTRKRAQAEQLELAYHQGRNNWGGRRKNSGRKPTGQFGLDRDGAPRKGVSHRTRMKMTRNQPVHVTAKVVPGLPSLRDPLLHKIALRAMQASCERPGFRVVHYTALEDHLHLIVEAESRADLSRGLQGLFIRMARRMNRSLQRSGSFFRDRYHEQILRTPRQVWSTLRYVLSNARRHGLILSKKLRPDPCSTAVGFDGWRDWKPGDVTGLPQARTWLLGTGWWKKHGKLSLADASKSWVGT